MMKGGLSEFVDHLYIELIASLKENRADLYKCRMLMAAAEHKNLIIGFDG